VWQRRFGLAGRAPPIEIEGASAQQGGDVFVMIGQFGQKRRRGADVRRRGETV